MSGKPADRVFFGGDVVTVDGTDTVAQAVAVREGRIAAVGRRDDVMALAGPRTVLTDLAGRALLPGFIDAHGHLGMTGQKLVSANLSPAPIGPVSCIANVQRELREQIERKGLRPGEWVVGMGYDDTAMEERRHPTRDDLDAVSREHPIVTVHVSGHLMGVNTMALELAGINASTADPEGGHFRRRGDGEPDGVLEETAMSPVFTRMPQAGPEEAAEQVRAACEYYASFGLTTAQEAAVYQPSFVAACRALDAEGHLPLDVVAYPLLIYARAMLAAGSAETGRFRFGGMKVHTDGSIQGYTAYLSSPYHVQPPVRLKPDPRGVEGYRGFPSFETQEKLSALAADGYENGWQVMAHANGDAVNRVTSTAQELGPEQRLTAREAVRAVTIDAARQVFEEDRKGSIEVGKLADLVVLSANPLTVEPMAIREITVEETVKEAETVYERRDSRMPE